MKRIEQSVLLAGLLAFGLSACSSMRGGDTASTTPTESATGISYGTPGTAGQSSTMGGTGTAGTGTGTGTETGATAGTATGTGTTGTAGTSETSSATGTTSTDPQSAAVVPNSVVTMIEVVPRQGDATGAGTMAGAAVGGTAGGTSDRVYRVTLRMDDGSTRVVTQEWAPTFRSGDRVNLSGGEIQRR
jgi:outer membrane lipoprotein SlyB